VVIKRKAIEYFKVLRVAGTRHEINWIHFNRNCYTLGFFSVYSIVLHFSVCTTN